MKTVKEKRWFIRRTHPKLGYQFFMGRRNGINHWTREIGDAETYRLRREAVLASHALDFPTTVIAEYQEVRGRRDR